MIVLLLTATLQIGVYYTFPAETIILHNRTSEVKIEKSGMDIKKTINELLKNTETTINREIFGSQKAIELKPVFIEYWRIENPPLVESAINIDEIWPLVEKLSPASSADFYLIIFANEIVSYNPYAKRFDKANGAARTISPQLPNRLFGDMIVLGNFLSAQSKDDTFRHELGHILGLKHTDCAALPIMCPTSISGRKIDEPYKKAWRDFYEARTGQRFQPSP